MKHILIIEDDLAYQKMLDTALTESGFKISVASDGAEGCKIFKKDPCDLVISDIFMPEKEGFETIMEIRQMSETVKILAISGGGQFDARDMLPMSIELGANEAVEKPIGIKDLLEIVNRLLAE
jgi:DNA-binding response OmpR family regulator